MAGAIVSHAAAALRRGFLLLGLLAVVTGFLGMHIMAGMHGAHAMTEATSSTETAGTSSRTANSPAPHPAAHTLHAGTTVHDAMIQDPARNRAAVPSASCVCQSNWTNPASMHSACVPSAAVTSLAAPPPGTAPIAVHNPAMPGGHAIRAYSHFPASPSPGDLSISRT